MCSYWRRSFELTPRRPFPLGIAFSSRERRTSVTRRWRRVDHVLPRLGHGIDLVLRPVQRVLGSLPDCADHLGGCFADPAGPALGVFTHLLAPVPHGKPSDERSKDKSKHGRPPFSLETLSFRSSKRGATTDPCRRPVKRGNYGAHRACSDR